jgi:hypothetical protein
MTLISFLGGKPSAVSEKCFVTMATYYQQGSRTKDGKGKNRVYNEYFGKQDEFTIFRVIKFLHFA